MAADVDVGGVFAGVDGVESGRHACPGENVASSCGGEQGRGVVLAGEPAIGCSDEGGRSVEEHGGVDRSR